MQLISQPYDEVVDWSGKSEHGLCWRSSVTSLTTAFHTDSSLLYFLLNMTFVSYGPSSGGREKLHNAIGSNTASPVTEIYRFTSPGENLKYHILIQPLLFSSGTAATKAFQNNGNSFKYIVLRFQLMIWLKLPLVIAGINFHYHLNYGLISSA